MCSFVGQFLDFLGMHSSVYMCLYMIVSSRKTLGLGIWAWQDHGLIGPHLPKITHDVFGFVQQ